MISFLIWTNQETSVIQGGAAKSIDWTGAIVKTVEDLGCKGPPGLCGSSICIWSTKKVLSKNVHSSQKEISTSRAWMVESFSISGWVFIIFMDSYLIIYDIL